MKYQGLEIQKVRHALRQQGEEKIREEIKEEIDEGIYKKLPKNFLPPNPPQNSSTPVERR